MALQRTNKRDNVPQDAVIITEDEALAYQWNIIDNWERRSEVWALRHTPGVIGCLAAATGIFVNQHFRMKLRLHTYGKLSTYLPIVVIPAIFSMLTHKMIVQPELILKSNTKCPLCLQLRSAAFQTGLGVIYPMLLSPLAGFMFATRHFTYRLPSITEQPMEVIKLWRKLARPIMPVMSGIFASQVFIAMYLTYKEQEQIFKLEMNLKRIEARMDREEIFY